MIADGESPGYRPEAYRPEIDGLRAFAVAAVILYHAGVPWAGAGYLGVDIFFAISGFLITGIIVRSHEQRSFSLPQFYMRRIRRIIPALMAMCLLTLPVACLLMIPDDLENFGQSMFATGLSANNILLYLTSGYFALETHFKPLFHTWSLGVEEQYYLAIPLLLLMAMRWGGRRGAIVLLVLCTVASLIACAYLRGQSSAANFLLLPSRLWELALGGLTAIAQPALLGWTGSRHRLRQLLAAAGLAMALSSPCVLASAGDLPGWPTLLPVLGTCLVLAFADRTGAGRLLAARPLAGIGLISYSTYLYHAPLFSLLRIASLEAPSPGRLLATVPLCLILAWLSWRYIERPFRDRKRTSNRQVLLVCAGATALVVGSGLMLHLTAGFFSLSALARHDQQLGRGLTALYTGGPHIFAGRPFPGPGRAGNVMVIGNSFARDFINMGLESGALSRARISYEAIRNCDPLPPQVIDRIRRAEAVIFGSRVAGHDAPCLAQKIALLKRMQVPHILVLGTKQFGYNNNAVMLLPAATRYSYRAKPLAAQTQANREARRIIAREHYVDLFALLDNGTGTVPVFTPERKFISQDRDHLTRAGAGYVGRLLFAQPQFDWLKKPGNQPRNQPS